MSQSTVTTKLDYQLATLHLALRRQFAHLSLIASTRAILATGCLFCTYSVCIDMNV